MATTTKLYDDDIILACRGCGKSIVCQHPRHVTAIGVRNDDGSFTERKPTPEDIERMMPRQGEVACSFACSQEGR